MKTSIRLFYFVYTVYILIFCAITNLNPVYLAVSLFIMWAVYGAFSFGFGKEKQILKLEYRETVDLFRINRDNVSWTRIFVIGVISIVIAIICARFYTGLTPVSLFQTLRSGESTYQHYQRYFASNSLARMTILKIPVIFLLAANRVLLYYSFITLSISARIKRKKSIVFLCLLSLGHLFFGLCRGTNIEMYQLFTLCVFCYILFYKKRGKSINYALLFGMGVIMVVFFLILLNNRGHAIEIRTVVRDGEIFLNTDSRIVQLFPTIVIAMEYTFGYLGYGLYYISVMIVEAMLSSLHGIIDLVLPFAHDSIPLTESIITRNVNWIPDLAVLIDKYGIVIVLLISFVTGRIIRNIGYMSGYSEIYYILCYFAFLEMLSLPIGDFLSFSSERLAIIFTILLLTYGRKVYIRIGSRVTGHLRVGRRL